MKLLSFFHNLAPLSSYLWRQTIKIAFLRETNLHTSHKLLAALVRIWHPNKPHHRSQEDSQGSS